MLNGIWMVIELGQEIMPTNNITKFDDDPLKKIQVTQQTRLILAILANSRAITPTCFMGSAWLSNLAEIFCQLTFSWSLKTIEVIERTNALDAARNPIICQTGVYNKNVPLNVMKTPHPALLQEIRQHIYVTIWIKGLNI